MVLTAIAGAVPVQINVLQRGRRGTEQLTQDNGVPFERAARGDALELVTDLGLQQPLD